MDQGEIIVLDTPEALKASVGKDRVQIQTDDDDGRDRRAARALRHRGDDRRGRGDVRRSPRASSSSRGCSPSSACRSARSAWRGRRSTTSSCPTPARRSATPRRAAERPRRRDDRESDARWRADGRHRRPPGRAARRSRVRVPRAQLARRRARGQDRLAARADPLLAQDRLRIVTSLRAAVPVPVRARHGPRRRSPAAGTHGVDLRTFVYPGVLCMAVMFTAMFSAASLVWDREFGFLREMMVAPVRRSSLVLGKCLGGATVAGFQGADRARARAARAACPTRRADPRGASRCSCCSRSRSPRSA